MLAFLIYLFVQQGYLPADPWGLLLGRCKCSLKSRGSLRRRKMDIDLEPWLNGLNYKVRLGRRVGGGGARAEIEVGTREKTKAVMLRKEGLSWRPHPSL